MRIDSERTARHSSEALGQKTASNFDKAARHARQSVHFASARPSSTSVDGGHRNGTAASSSKNKPEGERPATGNGKWPSVRAVLSGDITISGNQKDGSLLYRDSDGKTVRVERDTNPALYDFLQSAADVPPSARWVMLNMDGRTFDKAQILRGDDSIALDRIEQTVSYAGSSDVLHVTMEDGTRFAVSRQLTPQSFAQVETLGEGGAKGETLADRDHYLTPSEMARARVGSPDESAGIVKFNLDGQEYIVSRDVNQGLYNRLVDRYAYLVDGSGAAHTPDERAATDNEKWPDVRNLLDSDLVMNGQRDDGSLLYPDPDSGDRVRVDRKDNPGLYDYVESVVDMPVRAQKDLLDQDKDIPILRGDDTLRSDVIEAAEWTIYYPSAGANKDMYRDGDVMVLTLEDGSQKIISGDLTPATYARLNTVAEGLADSNDEQAQLVDGDHYLTSGDLDQVDIGPPDTQAGIVNFNQDGQEYLVTRDTNRTLYNRLVGEYETRTNDERIGDIDTARRDSDLPEAGALDTLSLETGVSDPADKAKKLTVNELAWQTVVKDWKTGIENGDIASDDDRAKLYRALQAKTAVDDGINMVTLDIRTGQNTAKTTSDDMGSVVDGVAVDEQINRLMDSEAVNNDLRSARDDALGKTEGGEEAAEKLKNMAFSDEYLRHIADLHANSNSDLAKADINTTYEQLMGVDPEKAAEFAQTVEIDAMAIDLDDLIANPDQISDESQTTATRDVGKVVLQQLKKAGIDLPRRTVETIDKFVNEFLNNKQTAKDFGKALQQLGDTFAKNGQLTQKNIDNLLKNGTYKALNERTNGGLLKTVSEMNKAGVLGTAGGMVSLASAVYQLAGKGGSLADTPEERLSIAKDFVAFIGAGRHAATYLTSTIDLINNTNTAATWNLDKSLPDLFGERHYNKGKGRAYDMDKFQRDFNDVVDRARPKDASKLTNLRNNFSPDEINKIQDGLDGKYHRRPNLPEGSTSFKRGASAALQIINAGADTFVGVADSVIGGLYLKKGMDSNNPQTVARGALQLASGIFGTAGGASSLAGLRGLNAAKVATAPSFWISAILSIATVIPDIVQDVKNTKKLNAYRDDLEALFTQLDKDGLLKEDGLQAFQYMQITMRGMGQRDAPDGQSVIDYRSEEFEAFKDYVAEIEGRPTGVFFESDGIEHEDYESDGDNLQTELDDGSGTLV